MRERVIVSLFFSAANSNQNNIIRQQLCGCVETFKWHQTIGTLNGTNLFGQRCGSFTYRYAVCCVRTHYTRWIIRIFSISIHRFEVHFIASITTNVSLSLSVCLIDSYSMSRASNEHTMAYTCRVYLANILNARCLFGHFMSHSMLASFITTTTAAAATAVKMLVRFFEMIDSSLRFFNTIQCFLK